MDQSLSELGITTPQFQALGVICAEPGLSGAELARDSMLTPQSIKEIVAVLERAGLVERSAHPRDQRIRLIYPTPAGERMIAAARERVHELEGRMVAGLTQAERSQFRRWLVDCAVALDEANGA
jgi:DNA-binding MarR family transcriptional regulator